MELARATLQAALLVPGAMGLWWLWRSISRRSRVLGAIAAGGFLVRAFAGQVAFWVSYLELPIARSLQRGNGFWFYALDGFLYFGAASRAAAVGPAAILAVDRTEPSVTYIQALASFCWLFGAVPSTALFMNVALHLATLALVVHWCTWRGVPVRSAAIAMVAFVALPSWILWSLQPLKDTFFCALIVLFAYAIDRLHTAVAATALRWLPLALYGLLALACLYALAGVRWYYACFVGAFAAAALLVSPFGRRPPRAAVARALPLVGLTLLFPSTIVAGAGPVLPPTVRVILQVTHPPTPRAVSTSVVDEVDRSQASLDWHSDAGTHIAPGVRLGGESVPGRSDGSSVPSVTDRQRAAHDLVPPSGEARPSIARLEELRARAPTGSRRLAAGLAALLLPRFVGASLGLVEIGGGRGLWWFAELDTLLVDLLMLAVAGLVIRRLRLGRGRLDLTFAFLALSTLAVGGALAFTVSNFGTMLRLRGMVVATMALLPVVLWRQDSGRVAVAAAAAPPPVEDAPRAA